MTENTTWWHEAMQKRKSLIGSFSDRRSRRSLVYSVRDAESLSGSSSCDPIEEKLDRISDDLQSLHNTLRAVANRVQDLEKVVSDKPISQLVQDIPKTDLSAPAVPTTQQNIRRENNELDSKKRSSKSARILDKAPPPPPPSVPKRLKFDLENIIKHELYRTVPKILVECCNLIEDHATIMPVDRLYLLPGDSNEIQTVLACVAKNNYKTLDQVKSIHTLASILKVFFQDLKYSVITASEIHAFLGSSPKKWAISSNGERIDLLQKLMKSLPEVNRDTMKYFVRHLRRLCRDYPKQINSQSLAISIAPPIFQLMRYKPKTSQENLRDHESLNMYLQFLIDHCDAVFRINHRTKFRKTLERCISCPGLYNM